MNLLITLCARGGSKGIPGKNIKCIHGKPLIRYSIALAKKLQAKYNAVIGLSTDSLEIKRVVSQDRIETAYTRPDYLATDSAGKIDTIRDLILYEEQEKNVKFDFILDLDVTSPLRTLEDVEQALEKLVENPEAKNIFSVNPAGRNPYFNMVEANENGFYTLVKKGADGHAMTRQSAPKVYELNASFYWYRRSFFDLGEQSAITDKSLIYEMKHICFDLDHDIDFLFMEYLLTQNMLDFEL